jgi:hypothetical protein
MEFLSYATTGNGRHWQWTKSVYLQDQAQKTATPSNEAHERAEFIEIRRQTDALQSLVKDTENEIRDQVDNVPAEPSIPINAPTNSAMILEEYRMSYFSKVPNHPCHYLRY